MTNRKVEMSVTLRKLRRGENGINGVGAYMLDLDNENANIGLTNSNGSLLPASGFNTGESGIYVAGGADNSAALSRVELIDANDNVLAAATASSNGSYTNGILGISSLTLKINKISVVFDTAKAHSSGERIDLRLRGTIGVVDSAGARNVVSYKTMTFMFQPPGADGVSPVVYELKPSVNAVVISKDGVRTPSTVTCKVIKHVGTDYIEVSNLAGDGLTMQAVSGGNTNSTSSVNVGSANDLKWVLKKGDAVIDEETIAFVKDGNDGQATNGTSPIILDLDNENESVPCNYSGTPIGMVNITSNASLYNGSTKITTGITWAIDKHNCTASISNGVVSVTAISADSAYVDVKATYQSKTYTARLSITKVRGGANGTSPTLYSIQPSVDAIHKDKDGNLSTSSITCTKYKQIGNGARQATTEKFLWCVVETPDGVTEKEYDGAVAVSSNTKDVLFILYEDSNKDTVLDRETVFVVSDGSDGLTPVVNDGQNAIVPVVTPSSISYNAGTAKDVPLNISIMDGDTAKTPTNITVKFGNINTNNLGGVTWDSANKKFAISSTATFNGIVTFTMVYNNKPYTCTVQFNKVLNGNPGPAGLIYRKTEFALGREYHNDTALLGSQALCYLDIVFKTGSSGQLLGAWTCKETHTSSESNQPNITASTQYWELCNIFDDPIYTPLILAQGSVIAFMQGNELKIFDTMGNLKAGISAASGDYPIFYANPQKYPTQVQVYFATSSNMVSGSNLSWVSNNSISSTNRLTLQADHYIHFKYVVSWSNGTSTDVYRTNLRNSTGGVLQTASPMPVKFCNTREMVSAEANAAPHTEAIFTSVAKPYLWIGAQLGNKIFGWYQIATQSGGVEDSTKAMFQVRESGDVTMGMPNGARINLVAAPTDGLPRMDIYDEIGNLSAVFDGTKVDVASELYGDGTASADLSGSLSTYSDYAAGDNGSADFVNVSTEKRTTISVDKDSTLTISTFTLSLSANFYNGSGATDGQYVVAALYVGSRMVSQGLLRKSEGTSRVFTFSQQEISLSRGLHNIVIRLSYKGQYGDGTQSASCRINNASTPIAFTASYGRLMCRYFSNGLAIGSATNNYFMAWNDNDGYMNLVIENKDLYGLKVARDGVYIKRPTNEATNDRWALL